MSLCAAPVYPEPSSIYSDPIRWRRCRHRCGQVCLEIARDVKLARGGEGKGGEMVERRCRAQSEAGTLFERENPET